MKNDENKTYTFHVDGMHCRSCVALTENELGSLPEISRVKSSLASRSVEITGIFGDEKPERIAQALSETLKPHGYTLSVETQKHFVRWSDFNLAVPAAGVFIALFIVLQKLGIVNLITTSQISYGTAFVIGLIASVSTCMAVVGGLTLSLSVSFAKEENSDFSQQGWLAQSRPQLLFHAGRLLSFFVLGGIIGALGSTFQFSATGALILNLMFASVLMILGVNLLDVFPKMKSFQPTMPKFIGLQAHSLKNINHTLTPALIGAATFFLPCGFTQSMQIYTLTTGNFLTGAAVMFIFALGTLPVLLLLSFSSLSILKKAQSGIFFKTAGLIVIFFSVFNLINALAAAGIIPPLFNF